MLPIVIYIVYSEYPSDLTQNYARISTIFQTQINKNAKLFSSLDLTKRDEKVILK